MKINEVYDVFGHEVSVLMENKTKNENEFFCQISVDGGVPYLMYCEFYNDEKISTEKPIVAVIDDALNYKRNDTLGEFLKNLGYNKSSQEINAGYMVFMASGEAYNWVNSNFTYYEREALYKAIDPEYGKSNNDQLDNEEEENELER